MKLATSPTITGIEKAINAFWASEHYRVDRETLTITNATRQVPPGFYVKSYRGGYVFGKADT